MKKIVLFTALLAILTGNAWALTGYQVPMVNGIGLFIIYDNSVTGETTNLDSDGVINMANTLLNQGPGAYGWNFVYVPYIHKNGSGQDVIDVFTVDSNRNLGQLQGVTVPLPSTYPPAACTDGGVLNGKQICTLSGNISSSVRLTSDKYWELRGKLTVASGAVLEVEAGTTVFGNKFDGTPRDYLVVDRGGKIKAIGTKNAPIVFTGRQALEGTDTVSSGQWGGVIMAGYARNIESTISVY